MATDVLRTCQNVWQPLDCWAVITLLFSALLIGRVLCVYPADAHYCADPSVLVKPVDGLQSSLFLISQIVSSQVKFYKI